ncbi:MAG TPA: SUMF1/EgtB/PvdO family nonheme iron enzyme [Blastocatellia bacterium]|nr:SUMF1/EgtB/PvdO family nonheme iron enzyme [Blastocatellia bacterium]
MYCAACNLNYADHLNFCRRCGQPLARSASEPVMDTVCCTRCGARTVRGEKFCQHCGARVVAPTPETVIGACYHCGTSWRSGWLFCKTCGLDRDRALLLPTSMPTASSEEQTAVSEADQLPEVVKLFCKRCGASAKPFSRYCETCGNTLDLSKEAPLNEPAPDEVEKTEKTVITGKLVVPPAAAAFRTQADSPTGRLQASLSERGQRQAAIESPPEHPKPPEPAEPAEIARAARKTAAVHDSLTTNFPESTDPLVGRRTNPGAEVALTAFPDPEDDIPIESEQLIQRSDSRGATVVWIIIVFLAVAAGLVAWQLRTNMKNSSTSANLSPSPSPDQATAPTSTALLSATPEAPASPAPTSGVATPAGMVFVPGGTFKMGRNNGDEFEKPAHTVKVKPFFIDRTEVTNEEYKRFVSATGHRAPKHWDGGEIPEGQTNFPVVNVSWDDANAYAQWAKKRLPTEAEWEFAARGTDGRIYPWGSGWKQDYANAGKSRNGALVETGRYEPGASPFGALDLCGNAWEWTSSEFANYPGRKAASSLAGAGLKVIRGGAYNVAPQRATSTYRGAVPPNEVFDKTGFRCAREAP